MFDNLYGCRYKLKLNPLIKAQPITHIEFSVWIFFDLVVFDVEGNIFLNYIFLYSLVIIV